MLSSRQVGFESRLERLFVVGQHIRLAFDLCSVRFQIPLTAQSFSTPLSENSFYVVQLDLIELLLLYLDDSYVDMLS